MFKKISCIIALGISIIALSCNNQDNPADATFLQFDERLKQDPDLAKNYTLREIAITDAVKAMNQRGEGALPSEVITIPVVVHIVGNKSDLGVTSEMVKQRIASLTRDFRRENEDELNQVPEAYRWLAADTRIQFKLAKKDIKGQPSTGIIYSKNAQEQSFTYAPLGSTPKERNPVKFADTSDLNAFPADKFLRIWVCQLDPALGEGYASLLADLLTRPSEDGIVIDVDYFNGSKAGRSKGRALTNLTAKWLGLKNIWGDSDNVDDTPKQTLPSNGRPTYPKNNGSDSPYGDMFNNFMDATDDDSRVMFTVGQADRIYQAVNLYRADFQYSNYADELGTPPAFLDYTVKDNAPDDGQEPNPADPVPAPTTTVPTTTTPTTTAPDGGTGPAITTTITAGKGGKPIEGVVVTVSRDGEQIGRATSGPDGTLTIAVPESGQYQVTLDKKSLPDGVEVQKGAPSTLTPFVQASGSLPVVFRLTEAGQADSGGGPSDVERLASLAASGIRFGLVIALGALLGLSARCPQAPTVRDRPAWLPPARCD